MVTEVRILIATVVMVVLTVGFFTYRHSLIADGEQKIVAAVGEATRKLTEQHAKDMQVQMDKDMAAIHTIENTYAKALTASNSSVDDLNRRLRAYASAGRSGTALPGDPATAAGPDDAPRIASGVEEAIEGVAAAAAHDDAKVIGLQHYVNEVCLGEYSRTTH